MLVKYGLPYRIWKRRIKAFKKSVSKVLGKMSDSRTAYIEYVNSSSLGFLARGVIQIVRGIFFVRKSFRNTHSNGAAEARRFPLPSFNLKTEQFLSQELLFLTAVSDLCDVCDLLSMLRPIQIFCISEPDTTDT